MPLSRRQGLGRRHGLRRARHSRVGFRSLGSAPALQRRSSMSAGSRRRWREPRHAFVERARRYRHAAHRTALEEGRARAPDHDRRAAAVRRNLRAEHLGRVRISRLGDEWRRLSDRPGACRPPPHGRHPHAATTRHRVSSTATARCTAWTNLYHRRLVGVHNVGSVHPTTTITALACGSDDHLAGTVSNS